MRELVERARSTDAATRDAAFTELVRELGPTLFAVCLRVTGNRVDAEDAVQDTLCSIANGLARFRGDSTLSTWAYRIALRAAVRMKAKARPIELPTVEPHTSDELSHVLAAMSKLPAEQRALLALFAEGLTHPEVADIVGVPVGTVWSRLHLARKRLREELDR